MTGSRGLWRRIAICATFATCCFLNTWIEFAEGKSDYLSRFDPLHTVAVPVIVLEIIITAALLGIWEFARRQGARHWTLNAAFLAVCLWPAGITAMALLRALPFDAGPLIHQWYFWPVALLLAMPAVVYAITHPRTSGNVIRNTLAYASVVAALIVVQAARHTLMRFPRSAYENGPLAKPQTNGIPPIRAVWIIFDEMSQTLAFTSRPSGLAMPNLDRLREVSLYATSARAPADATERSMPSLLLGQTAVSIEQTEPGEWIIHTAAKPQGFPLSKAKTIFDTAQEAGLNTAVVGWYLPYCRLISHSLTQCDGTAPQLMPGVEEPFEPQSLPDAMQDRLKWQLTSLPLAGRIPALQPEYYFREEKRKRFAFLRDQAMKTVSDANIGLALIHLPVPHPPSIYNRREKILASQGQLSYVDSLALADQTLGDLRQAMEKAGVWDRTAVIVTADHSWRTNLWSNKPDWTPEEQVLAESQKIDHLSVPFLIKLPNQTQGNQYTGTFNTVITGRLITQILQGRSLTF